MGIQTFDQRTAVFSSANIIDATGTGLVSLDQFSGFGVILTDMIAANSDVIDHVLNLSIDTFGTVTELGSVTVPARAGWDGTKAIDMIAVAMPTNWAFPAFGPTCTLRLSVDVAMGTGTTLDVSYWYGKL